MINNETSMPPSPWKKPKPRVSLLKTKSFKRKSDIFNLSNNDSFNSSSIRVPSDIPDEDESAGQNAKERKTMVNRFSIKNRVSGFALSRDTSLNFSNLNESGSNSILEVFVIFN